MSEIVTLNDNGAWCWYQDERVLIDQGNNLRPIVPKGAGGKVVLWLRGTMTASQHYKCKVAAWFD